MALGDFLFPHLNAKLVIARSFESDIESVQDKFTEEYQKTTALVRLNTDDLKRLGLKDDMNVEVKAKDAKVVVRVVGDSKVRPETAVMIHGPWALALVSMPEDNSPPQLHGMQVSISKTEDEITSIQKLVEP